MLTSAPAHPTRALPPRARERLLDGKRVNAARIQAQCSPGPFAGFVDAIQIEVEESVNPSEPGVLLRCFRVGRRQLCGSIEQAEMMPRRYQGPQQAAVALAQLPGGLQRRLRPLKIALVVVAEPQILLNGRIGGPCDGDLLQLHGGAA